MSKTLEGIVFPLNAKGERSTTDTGKEILAAVFTASKEEELAKKVKEEKNFRYRYNLYFVDHVRTSLKSPETALDAAKAGLNYLHDNFEFIRGDKTMKLSEAMKNIQGNFHTGFIKGKKSKTENELVIPYKGKQLKGKELQKQIERWVSYGTIEPDAGEAILQVINNPSWCDLSDKYFVLLGAGAAMGPFEVLMSLGANIIAVDLDLPRIWKRLITIAQESSGTITFPLKKPQSEIDTSNNFEEIFANAGSNLSKQTPEINNWLQSLYPDKSLTIGCYVYLNGEDHVKVALACDAIMKQMSENRRSALAFLCTPTDAHVITTDARRAAIANLKSYRWINLLFSPVRIISGKKILISNVLQPVVAKTGDEFNIVDGLVLEQGPNYALAKRMQHWRAIVAREGGSIVSTHVAPSTATASVVQNRQFAWAYEGMPFFVPYEIFEQQTSNAVMCSILLHDLGNLKSVAHPDISLRNPLELFKYNSFHGGVWRCAYKVGSIGEVSVIIKFFKMLQPLFLILFLLVSFLFFRKFI
jgi:hypothetical protein